MLPSSHPQPTPSGLTTAKATAVTGPAGGSALSDLSVLGALGWKSLDGRVIQVEPIYMGTPDSQWGLSLLKIVALFGIAYYFATQLLIVFVLLAVVAWFLAKILRGGFVSAVAVQVTSFMLTRRLLGPVASIQVRDVRVRDGNGQETLVRMKGQLVSGSLSVGDDVHVEGFERGGTLLFRRGYNNRIRAEIRVKRP